MGIFESLGAYSGSKRERKGYKDASAMLQALKPEIKKAQQLIDPWSRYRSGYADQLNATLQHPDAFRTDPGYEFRVKEDERATERAASARGSNISGNVLAELGSRRQQIASQEYNNVINRLIGLSAATPENAIAGGQFYGNAMSQIAFGQAESEIGAGFAASRGRAALGSVAGEAVGMIMNMISPGMGSAISGGSAPAQGQQTSISPGSTQGGYTGSQFGNWSAQQPSSGGTGSAFSSMGFGNQGMGGMAGTNFGAIGGSTSSVGSMF